MQQFKKKYSLKLISVEIIEMFGIAIECVYVH